MNLEEYSKTGQKRYEKLGLLIKKEIEKAIKENIEYSSKVQCIKSRAKSIHSLENKLVERQLRDSNIIEKHLKDLSGCRIVFYYNDDINKFINSRIVNNNFKVYLNDFKLHFTPKNEISCANEVYRSIHYIVGLKEETNFWTKYPELRGLKCEIQLHTSLSDLYAQTAHDTTYKNNKIPGFGNNDHKLIDKKLQKIGHDLLIPAGYELQAVRDDFQGLLKGQDLHKTNILENINKNTNNNEIYDILDKFKYYILPRYDCIDKNIFLKIFKQVKSAIDISKTLDPVPIEEPWRLPGKTSQDILNISLEILDKIKYFGIEEMFCLLIDLYLKSGKEEDANITNNIEKLANYNTNAWPYVGSYPQRVLISYLEKLDKNTLAFLLKIVLRVCNCALNPIIQGGVSNAFDSYSFITGMIPATEEIKNIRCRTLKILEDIYTISSDEREKVEILNSMLGATRIPSGGKCGDSEKQMISTNIERILLFFQKIIPASTLPIIRYIEGHTIQISRLFDNDKINKIKVDIISLTSEMEDYQIYKNLVGWDDFIESEIYEEKQEYRKQKALEYASSITQENFDTWVKRIIDYPRFHSNSSLYFFDIFLENFGKLSAILALRLLRENEDEIKGSSVVLLCGIWKSDHKEEARQLINTWIDKEKYLEICARIFECNKDIDEGLLKRILKAAKKTGDENTLTQIINTITANYNEKRQYFTKEFFLPAIRALTKRKCTRWIINFRYPNQYNEIASKLDDQGIDTILTNLLSVDSINYCAEKILAPLASNRPEKIIKFFGKRLKFKEELKLGSHYNAIPFEFYGLSEQLSQIPEAAVDIVSQWYDDNYGLFVYRGANLLKIIFPLFPKSFQDKLEKLIHTGEERNLLVVMAILENYEGELVLHDICKEIINALPDESQYLEEVESILEKTGVVVGEFGFAEAYKRKKDEVESWLNDKEEKVRKFAGKYRSNLEERILFANRRAEEDIELRKAKFRN